MVSILFEFDLHGTYETPVLTLYNPNRQDGIIMGGVREVSFSPVFDGLSELTLKVPYHIYESSNPYYVDVVKHRLIKAEGLGWFVIKRVDEDCDGLDPIKSVRCVSEEETLNYYGVNVLDGTYKMYDLLEPDKSLITKLLSQTQWKVGTVDPELWDKYRTFEFSEDEGLYSFLKGDFQDAYDCVCMFNTESMTVDIYPKGKLTDKTDIMLTYDNLIKEANVSETDDNVVTALTVTGDKDLDIRAVNPLGTNVLYDFSTYKSWMSDSLQAALDAWETKLESQREPYSALLTRLREENAKLIKLKGELVDLQVELESLENIRDVQQQQQTIDLTEITQKIQAKEAEIAAKQAEVDAQQSVVDEITKQKNDIAESLKFENNFTDSQFTELKKYIHPAKYQNDNYTVTDIMTPVDIQAQAELLYEDSLKKLKELSVPTYTLELDVVNFLFLQKYQKYQEWIKLGATVNAEIRDDYWVQPILVKMEIDYDRPDNCKLIFSDKFRLMDALAVFDDYDSSYSKSVQTYAADNDYLDGIKDSGMVDYVNDLIAHGLNVAKTEIINAKDQSITINQHGLLGKKVNEDGSVDPEQVKLINNKLVFTSDNWLTLRAAIGKINYNNQDFYGIIADAIIGRLLAGNQLSISNEKNNFTLDANGCVLNNATFTLVAANGTNRILLDPQLDGGIKIQKAEGSSWIDQFYADSNGNLTLAGSIIAESGTIGGWTIHPDKLQSPVGDYIGSNGYGKISLMTYTPYSATFNGNIYARNLLDKVEHDKVGNDAIGNNNIQSGAVDTNEIRNDAVTPAKLDRVYATEIEVERLIADEIEAVEARFDRLIAKKADISDLNATNAKLNNLQAQVAYIDKMYVTYAEVKQIVADYLNGTHIHAYHLSADYMSLGGHSLDNGYVNVEGNNHKVVRWI